MWRCANQTVVLAGAVVGIVVCSTFAENKFAAVTFQLSPGGTARFAHVSIEGGVQFIRDDLPPRLNSLTRSPDGMLYAGASGEAGGELYSIHPVTGEFELLHVVDVSFRGLAMSPAGVLYATDRPLNLPLGPHRLLTIDVDTGESNFIGELRGDIATAQGLGFSPDGVLYGISPHGSERGTYDFFTIDQDDAVTNLLGSDLLGELGQSVEFAPDGSAYAIGRDGLCEINPNSGVCIDLEPFGGDWRGLAYIPEPAPFLILCTLVLAGRRQL